MYDLIIIGGGPAGLTAGVYAARKQIQSLVLTKEFGGQPMWTNGVENYMGYQFVTGPELMIKFDEQIRQFPIELKYEEVAEISKDSNNIFHVKTNLNEYEGKTVILATGKRPRKLNVPGEEKFIGRGVAFCATCDGPFYKDKIVAVVGGGNSGVQAAIELSGIAKHVHIITRDPYNADPILMEKFNNLPNLTKHEHSVITVLEGDESLEKMRVRDLGNDAEEDIAVDGIFVEIGLDPNSEMVKSFLTLNSSGEVPVDLNSQTEIPGLFAAGDITNIEENQIIIAAGEGSKAALKAFEYLLRFEG